MAALLLIPIIFPIVMGFILMCNGIKDNRQRHIYVAMVCIINMILAIVFMFTVPEQSFTVIRFSEIVSITFRVDGLSTVFGMIVSTLWVVTAFYAFEYMSHEHNENKFFSFFIISFGVIMGIVFAANLITMYLFYELLTAATLPLVMHEMDKKAASAGKKYVIYSITGASFGFIAIMLLMYFGVSLDFVYGGILTDLAKISGHEQLLLVGFICAFFGFGVKAAIFPFFNWLPSAGVAPTPVTALLHAVAVVNAGVFAIMRVTYYSFGTDLLYGTWAQFVCMLTAIITIIFGSSMALRENHIKRRLAYSTVSNLSYMLFSLMIMTPEGLVGGMTHMMFHSVLKITLFFVAGAIIVTTGREYVDQLAGFGKTMPITMAAFTICSLGLIGVPPLMAITSKWMIGTAAANTDLVLSYVGIGALIISAVLTSLYLFQIIIKAYFPDKGLNLERMNKGVKDPGKCMTIPMMGLSIASIVIGVYPTPFINMFQHIAGIL